MKFIYILHRSKFTDKRLFIAGEVFRTEKYLMIKSVFEIEYAGLVSELPSITKKYSNTIPYSVKMNPTQAPKKVNEKAVFFNLQDEAKKLFFFKF